MKKNIDVLYDEKTIQKRVKEIADRIECEFQGKPLTVIGVLKGSFIFMADLVRNISTPLTCDFIRVASYEKDKSTGTVRLEFDLTQPIAGKDVLLVEDIVDTGVTLKYLLELLKAKNPKSLKVATLLHKETGNGNKNLVDYVGFEVPDKYVIGYGLDSEGLYRSLPYIGVMKT